MFKHVFYWLCLCMCQLWARFACMNTSATVRLNSCCIMRAPWKKKLQKHSVCIMHLFCMTKFSLLSWFVRQKQNKSIKETSKLEKLQHKLLCLPCVILAVAFSNIEDGSQSSFHDLFNQRQEGKEKKEKKRVINYFCELWHRRDNKPAWSPWIWHICSENNTIISKGERSGENMRNPGLKCQWSIPVLISIPENNNTLESIQQTFIDAQKNKRWPFYRSVLN